MKWVDFEDRVRKNQYVTESWTFGVGEALYTDGNLSVAVRLRLENPYSLEPEKERDALAESDKPDVYEAQTMSSRGINDPEDIEMFWKIWTRTVGGLDLAVFPPPPPGYRVPAHINFTERQLHDFHKRLISQTPLAPVFGQRSSYLSEPVLEFNAGEDQGQVEGYPVIYRQEWVYKIKCPFCLHDEWNQTLAYNLRKPEQEFYSGDYFAITCPKCDRVVDVTRKNVDILKLL